MPARRIVSTVFLVALTLSAAADAQDAAGAAPETALESIDRTLKEIVELLRVQLGNQRAELAVRRLDIASRELVAWERELHEAETQREAYARNREQMKASVEEWRDYKLEDTGMTEAQFENALRQMELDAEGTKQSLWKTDQRIVDLRKEITRVREDLLAWEEIVATSFADEE